MKFLISLFFILNIVNAANVEVVADKFFADEVEAFRKEYKFIVKDIELIDEGNLEKYFLYPSN